MEMCSSLWVRAKYTNIPMKVYSFANLTVGAGGTSETHFVVGKKRLPTEKAREIRHPW